ncbi:MAG: chromate transporter [Tissierellia bacterium]|nr:chromate transporter [Tissierellia bacterium]
MLFQLYFSFVKIGLFSFGGGYASLPLIQQYIVEEQGWITMKEFTDLVSISQMTPGPIAINSATFVGTKLGGIPGAVIATLGVVTPQTLLMLIFGYFLFTRKKKFESLEHFILTAKPAVVGLIAIAAISMIQDSIFTHGFFNRPEPIALITFFIGLILYFKKVDLIKLIGIGAFLGAFLSYFFPKLL